MNPIEEADLLHRIRVDEKLYTPKYKQIIRSVLHEIRDGNLKVGDQLPSINAVSIEHLLSRETVVRAYNELRERGIIESRHGKGYYIKSEAIHETYNVCLLFNKLSAHKKTIYDAIVQSFGNQARIDLYVYHNDFETFKSLINRHAANYTHFIIISHFYGLNRPVSEALKQIPHDKIVILDREIKNLHASYAAVYQNFSEDLYRVLTEAGNDLRKYDRLNLVFPDSSYHPLDIKRGFTDFCEYNGFNYRVLPEFQYEALQIKEAYILMEEHDLVSLLRTAKERNLELGKDIGVISYNESPLKEFIAGGLTVVSTDFQKMGETAAEMVLEGRTDKVENPFVLIRRKSL
ncbi:substrate-binding protein-like domain-containing protein [Catalinimonas alkaloidigena]|uniref:Substrate-binding protein-like domain-containing protein n=1 Tax=Catalinimonas alkaloidigena TaxID=1075417 RepID=A0A1G9KKY6_9BACT|nr:GntR family transcriptional regulator [Catalinimonas alkaloidigena]SDL50073.1 substrate-binding protein-like domain-containing protein [Catalinimonas alkaloidigena]